MSRLALKIIPISESTTVDVKGHRITIKGSKGELMREFHDDVIVEAKEEGVKVSPKRQTQQSRVLWGTWASHVRNMIHGVENGYEKKLNIQGVGYKGEVQGNTFVLNVGFSHPVKLTIPEGVKAVVEKNLFTISGIDIEAVGQFAASIRDVKRVEPYKGHGISYVGEYIRRKQGKKAA